MSIRLRLERAPALRLDLRSLTPAALAGLGPAAIERLPLHYGNGFTPLAEWFQVGEGEADVLAFEGDLSRCDRIGWAMSGGRIVVDGPAGDYAGALLRAGEVQVRGDAGLLAGCEMSGGRLDVQGNAGDFAASTLPGSMDGMRGGTLVVRGDAGQRFGDRMRRGTAVVFGDAGDFLASRLVAGTLAIGGRCGAHPGYAMRRGSVVFAGGAGTRPALGPTFVPSITEPPVFWQLLARDLAAHGGPFTNLASRRFERHLGDLAADGRGEFLLVR